MEWLSDPSIWASLATLTALEIVLGIDNLVFLSIVTEKLPEAQRPLARRIGLGLALGMRVALLSVVVWIASLVTPVFSIGDHAVSWRDMILLGGGLFLIAKGTYEIHAEVEGQHGEGEAKASTSFAFAIAQIVALDLVFSLDSVITAIGMTQNLPVMITAVVIAMAVMLFAAGPVSRFIRTHPTTKMLALSFLLLIGTALIADGLHYHIERGFIYAAIVFSVLVEILNLAAQRARRGKAARRN
ncbi:MAG: TerC family protein [Minwuia sp.]|nr:TerC family protein [Minwuia sp.]